MITMDFIDPFTTLEPKTELSNVVIQEVINPVPGNSVLSLQLTDFQKGLIVGFILIYMLKEL